MSPTRLLLAALVLAGVTAQAADLEVSLPAKHFALLESYCLDCHDGETQKGKVNLEALSFKVSTVARKELEVRKTAAAVHVITSEDIRRSGAN